MSKVVVVGAGKTGRGFIGRLLTEAGKEIIFVDKNKELVDRLNQEGSFQVAFFGNRREPLTVGNYKAYTWDNADFEDAELIFVSVCGQNLEAVGQELSKVLKADKQYYIITCENASRPSQTLKNAIKGKKVAVSESTVFCTTIESDGYNINSENYPYLQCNAELLEGYVPPVSTVKAISNFSNFLTRKLFTYNAASCVIAYLGAMLGYTDYGAAANDPAILALLDKNYAATNRAMCAAFGYDAEDQREFAALSKTKFCDRTIVDTVARNAREPHRKLGGSERIIGAAKLLRQQGEDASVLELTAAAALMYCDSNDPVWSELRSNHTYPQLLEIIGGLQEGDALQKAILAMVSKLEADAKSTILEAAK